MKGRFRYLTTGQKTLWNFVVLGLAAGLCWALLQVPLWLVERAVAAQAQGLVGNGESLDLLWRGDAPYRYMGQGAGWTGGTPLVLARAGQWLLRCEMSKYEGNVYLGVVEQQPWPEQTALLCVTTDSFYEITRPDALGGLVAVNLPQGTQTGRLVLHTPQGETIAVTGSREQDVIFFWVAGAGEQLSSQNSWQVLSGASYSLDLLDGQGTVLHTGQGSVEQWG